MIVKAETAKLLADKEFDIEGEHYYLNDELFTDAYFPSLQATKPNGAIFAPRQWLAQKWLRDRGFHIEINCYKIERPYYYYEITEVNTGKRFTFRNMVEYSIYEEVLENSIIESLNLI